MSLNYANPVYIYRHSTGLARPSTNLMDPLGGSSFGFSYSSGDVNGDGLWDVIVSSVTASDLEQDGLPANAGRVYVFLGSAGGVLAEPVTLSRARPGMEVLIRHNFGSYPVSPGDINGDGIDDVTMIDTLGARLCVRHGRLGFASGSPDVCLEGFNLSGALTY